jgi:general secretion pathway protein A
MYEKFFGLKEKPFSLTPDPEFLFVNRHFRGALDSVIYGIQRQEGFTAIVGDVGTGKTTLCWSLLGKLDKGLRTALILNPLLTADDMLKAILQDFGVVPAWQMAAAAESDEQPAYDPSWMQGLTRKELIDELNIFLLEGAEQGLFNILIIDEAQNLSSSVLEQLRILSNLETAKKKLLQIIFVGQLEFEHKLQLPQLRQLNQRITIRYTLKPLAMADTIQYIGHRLSVAGSQRGVTFNKGAFRAIYSYSKGYPRLINVICDRSLLEAYTQRSRTITARMVQKAAIGLRGKEKGGRTWLRDSRKILIPVAALILLALLTALFFFGSRLGAFSSLRAEFGKRVTEIPSTVASEGARPGTRAGHQALPERANQNGKIPATESPGWTNASFIPTAAAAPAGRVSEKGEQTPGAGAEQTGANNGYLVQVHSLATMSNAEMALAELERIGCPGFVRTQEARGIKWFVVLVGPYETADLALSQIAALKQHNLNAIMRH